jgi:hypothetical protein
MKDRNRTYDLAYWSVLALCVLLKAALVSDLGVVIRFSPHDDSLYVSRAYSLLNGEAFGPYDSHTLSKLPGISLWLAGSRLVGVPYLLGLNALYVAVGLYAIAGFRRVGAGRALCAAAFLLYLMNPITMGPEWHRTLREPVGTVVFVAILAAMLHLLNPSSRRWPHIAVLALSFSFCLVLREEDRLLWAALGMFALFYWRVAGIRRAGIAVLIPAIVAVAASSALRAVVERNYGLPILNDYSEGEFPRLMAAIRSVESKTDNRLVMAPQETLQRFRNLLPEFAPVVDRLPPPGPGTFSCKLQGVCSEWSNGWMPWWIKDASFEAGRTPDLPSGQRYFAFVRKRIEEACRKGQLKCVAKGEGIIPPFELRWTRAYVQEAVRLAAKLLYPKSAISRQPRPPYNASPEVIEMYYAVTMTDRIEGYSTPLSGLRVPLVRIGRVLGGLLILISAVALVCRWVLYPNAPAGPVSRIATIFWTYSLVRMAALGYVAVFLGPFDSRIMFTTYTAALLLSPFVIADAVQAARVHRAQRAFA